MSKIILTRGIQGSGKSTWAKAWAKEDPKWRVRFCNDDIRNMFGEYWVPSRESLVSKVKQSIVHEAMLKDLDIVIDNMNLNDKEEQFWTNEVLNYNLSHDNSYEIEYKDFFIPVEECIIRDSMRPNPIGEKVIKETWRKYRTKICSSENIKATINRSKREFTPGLNMAVVFDMDATLCYNVTSRPYWGDGSAPGMLNDSPNMDVLTLAKEMQNSGYELIILTGREGTSSTEEATVSWLKKYDIVPTDIIFRQPFDYRPGQEVKLEALKSLDKQYNILFVVDDSTKVCNALRENGYTVLQPNVGNF